VAHCIFAFGGGTHTSVTFAMCVHPHYSTIALICSFKILYVTTCTSVMDLYVLSCIFIHSFCSFGGCNCTYSELKQVVHNESIHITKEE
jgi:hypothetical protein